MEAFYYLGALLVSIAGLVFIDYRFKLAFFNEPKRTTAVLLIAIGLFLIWDLAGIKLGIFFNGPSPYDLGIFLLPELPVEELFFLFLLNYTALLLYLGFRKKWQRI